MKRSERVKIETWFNKMIVPHFFDGCLPSWNWVLDVSERYFADTKEVYDILYKLYKHHEEQVAESSDEDEVVQEQVIPLPSVPPKKKQRLCGICRQPGHDRRTCPECV